MLKGFSMPLSPQGKAPLFDKPPKHFGGKIFSVVFRPDRQALADLVPDPLQLPDDPVCIVRINELLNDQGHGDDYVNRHPEASQYNEAVVAMPLVYKGVVGNYDPYIWVDNYACAAGGREIYGLPKKIGKIFLSRSFPRDPIRIGSHITGTLEANSSRLMTAHLDITRKASPSELPKVECFYCLRLIPSPEEGCPPQYEILRFKLQNYTVHEIWGGNATLDFGSSEFDELDILKPKEILGGFLSLVDWDLPYAEIIYRK